MKSIPLTLTVTLLSCSCARNWVNYPPGFDGKSGRPVAARAVEFNGSDLLGGTVIDVSHNGVRIATTGGIDNRTSTREGYRTVRHGVGTAATAAVLGIGLTQAANAYGANQAAASTSNVAASKASAATAASKSAETIRLAEIAAAKDAAAATRGCCGEGSSGGRLGDSGHDSGNCGSCALDENANDQGRRADSGC